MNEYEWVAWQALSDLVRLVMITGWLGLGWLAWRAIKSELRGSK